MYLDSLFWKYMWGIKDMIQALATAQEAIPHSVGERVYVLVWGWDVVSPLSL